MSDLFGLADPAIKKRKAQSGLHMALDSAGLSGATVMQIIGSNNNNK